MKNERTGTDFKMRQTQNFRRIHKAAQRFSTGEKPNSKNISNKAYDTHFYECPPLFKLQDHHPSRRLKGDRFLWQGSVLRKNNIPNRRFNNEHCNISDTLIVELCAVKWYNITNDHVLPKGKNMMISVCLCSEIWFI